MTVTTNAVTMRVDLLSWVIGAILEAQVDSRRPKEYFRTAADFRTLSDPASSRAETRDSETDGRSHPIPIPFRRHDRGMLHPQRTPKPGLLPSASSRGARGSNSCPRK